VTTANNIIAATQSPRVDADDPQFKDIVTAADLHELIMKSLSSDVDRRLNHFLLTPIDVIDPG